MAESTSTAKRQQEMVTVSGHWGWLLAVGIIEVIAGLLAVVYPGITVVTLAVFWGIGLLVLGIASVAMALRLPSGATGKGWAVILGILAVIAGLICLFRPGTGVVAILIGLAIWFFAAGINDIARAIAGPSRVLPAIVGVLSLVAGVIVLLDPWTGVATVAVIVGIGFMLRGLFDIVAAFAVRKGVSIG